MAELLDLLSPREREVVPLYASGATHAEIAAELSISRKTVESHAAQIRKKLGAGSRVEVAVDYHLDALSRERDKYLAALSRLAVPDSELHNVGKMAEFARAALPTEVTNER